MKKLWEESLNQEQFKRSVVSFYQENGLSLSDTATMIGIDEKTLTQWQQDCAQEKTLAKGDVYRTWMGESGGEAHEHEGIQRPMLTEKETVIKKTILGEGGMGLVSSALQLSMGREIAIKEIRPERKNSFFCRLLLQEAWVTGFLEHPSIIPIYTITQNEDNEPIILMKKIAGKTWASMLHDPRLLQEENHSEPLLWHLETLIRVCHPVHYAHLKGIIHRDLKPENIMLGAHGELYVLDWGLAVAIDDRHSSWIPRACNVQGVAGSPMYMAPEMTKETGEDLCIQTDVYLLGAILYECVHGYPPHRGDSLPDLISSIHAKADTLVISQDVDEDLAGIIQKAMSYHPNDRFVSVEDFRLSLQKYLERMRMNGLIEGLAEELSKLRISLEAKEHRPQIYSHFFAARFAWKTLKDASIQGVVMKDFVEQSLELARWELSEKRPEDAELILSMFDHSQPELEVEIAEQKEKKLVESRAQQKLSISQSQTIGLRTRRFVMYLAILNWSIFPIWHVWINPEFDFFHLNLHALWTGLYWGAIGLWARHSLSSTERNRYTFIFLMAEPFLRLFSNIFSQFVRDTPQEAWLNQFFLWTIMFWSFSLLVERRMLIASAAYTLIVLYVAKSQWDLGVVSLVLNVSLAIFVSIQWHTLLADAEDARTFDRSDFL